MPRSEPTRTLAAFAVKTGVDDPTAADFAFAAQKTMYGGKLIGAGDPVFLFASETQGGQGLFAKGRVVAVSATPRLIGVARQTPRVGIVVRRTAATRRRLGRAELKAFTAWNDGRPETELNFKLYRQATNKIIGLTAAAAAFLDQLF